MAQTFVKTTFNRAPELKDYEFNFEMGRFTDGKGQPVTGEAMAEKVGGRKGIGEKTARRAVLLQTLIRSESKGVGQRNGILEQVLHWGNSSSTPGSLNAIFSRRAETADNSANRADPASTTRPVIYTCSDGKYV